MENSRVHLVCETPSEPPALPGVKFRDRWLVLDQLREARSHVCELRIVGQIVHLVRIGRFVEEHRAAVGSGIFGITPAVGPYADAGGFLAVLAPDRKGRVIPSCVGIVQQRHQAAAF